MHKVKTYFFLVCILTSTVLSQVNTDQFNNYNTNTSLYEVVKSDAVTFYNVGYNLFKSPFQFDTYDLLLTGSILTLTAASFPIDQPIRRSVAANHNRSIDNITSYAEKFGNPKYGTILSGLLYGGGLIIGDNYIRQTGQMLAEAMLFNGLITTGAKMMFNRSRPFINKGSYELELFEFESEFEETSLPSGHTSTAFTVATVLSQRIDNIYASIALYFAASLTAYQRIYADKHWFSDTILGAAIGTAVGLKVVKLHEGNSSSNNKIQYSIYPQMSASQYGLGFAVQF